MTDSWDVGRRGFPSGGNFRTLAPAVRADRAQERCCWGDRPAGARDPLGPGKTSTGAGETRSGREGVREEAPGEGSGTHSSVLAGESHGRRSLAGYSP